MGDRFTIASAGSRPAGQVHPLVIRVMAETGMGISAHRSKHLDELLTCEVETVINHRAFDNPAHAAGWLDQSGRLTA